MEQIVDDAVASRFYYGESGHDISRVSIGNFGGVVKIADGTGAYEFTCDNGIVRRKCLGHPEKVTQWIAYDVKTE